MELGSYKLNPKLLKRLQPLQQFFLIISSLIAIVILSAWVFPEISGLLPNKWALMKANTALCVLFCAFAQWADISPPTTKRQLAGKLLGALIVLLAGSALVGHFSGQTSFVETLIAEDSGASIPGLMSLQTAAFFFLFGFSCFCEGENQPVCNVVRDLIAALIVMLALMVLSGYLFGATEMFGQAEDTRTSPHTLLCMILLVTSLLITRMHYGYFSLLAGIGIGSQIARAFAPVALLLPFLIINASAWLFREEGMTQSLAAALTTSISAAVLFVALVWVSAKINRMEAELRDISLIDHLTNVSNRRGFYLLGEQMLFEAERDGRTVTVLFFDLDGLKDVNDTLGHDIGSDLLKHFASLLRDHFRKSDVVARLGGDEFAVVSSGGDAFVALKRLTSVINAVNKAGNRPYQISYSVGEAIFSESSTETGFTELVAKADAKMYQRKRARKKTDRILQPPQAVDDHHEKLSKSASSQSTHIFNVIN